MNSLHNISVYYNCNLKNCTQGVTKMEITDVKIRKIFEEGPMRAIASVTLDDQLAVHDIKVISAREKLFIVMPSRKNPDETFRDIVHPINAGFRAALEGAVLEAYRVALANAETEAEAEEPVTV